MDELHRARLTPQLRRVMRQLGLASNCAGHGNLALIIGRVLLLGPGDPANYGAVEQSALQVLCGQLAVAIENGGTFHRSTEREDL